MPLRRLFPREDIYTPLPGQKRRISGLLKALRDKKKPGFDPAPCEKGNGNRQIRLLSLKRCIYFNIIKRPFAI